MVPVSPSKSAGEILEIGGQEVRVSSPDKVVFPEPGLTKLDVVKYYLAVADGALNLVRFSGDLAVAAFFAE